MNNPENKNNIEFTLIRVACVCILVNHMTCILSIIQLLLNLCPLSNNHAYNLLIIIELL